MISTILFDFGGTLDSDGGHWLDRFFIIFEQIGLGHIPKERIKEAFYWADAQAEASPLIREASYREMMERHVRWQFERLGIRDTKREAAAAEAFAKPSERVLRRNRQVLEKFKFAGYHLGVISNFYGNIPALCREAGLDSLLDVMLDSAVEGLRKPDAAFYELALKRLKADPATTAMVGDSFERDILPAKSLGMKTFWIVGGTPQDPPDASKVDGILFSLEDLPSKLLTPTSSL